MRSKPSFPRWSALALALTLPVAAHAAAFTAGNLVIYRVGNGAGSLVNTGNAAFLDEYSPAGGLVQSIPLPTATVGAQRQCITGGTSTSEGLISRSADNQYLIGSCYGADPGGATSLSSTTSAAVNRVVFRASSTGALDTSTALSDYASAGSPRGATSTNGADLWVTGSTGGSRYAPLGATTSTQISTTATNLRQTAIVAGQLYVSAQTGAIRLATVGSGTPTTAGNTITNLPGFPTATGSPYGFAFFDLDAGVAGVDTVYVADDSAGLQKYSLVGGNWTLNNTIGVAADAYRGLTGVSNGTTVTLYATRKAGSSAAGGGEFVTLVDSSGYNANNNGTPTILATAAANTTFRGIAFAPVSPQPSLSISAPMPAAEGNTGCSGGSTTFNFTVTASSVPSPGQDASFTVSVAGSGANPADSGDFGTVPMGGTIASPANTATVAVPVSCDESIEPDETFTVSLTGATNATVGAPSSAQTTILNDDPRISIDDATIAEGNSGSANLQFRIFLTAPAPAGGVTFAAQTSDGTATTADNDYQSTSVMNGLIPAGSTEVFFNVPVNGDTNIESNETFNVTLSNLGNAFAGDLAAVGTITNDDSTTISVAGGSVAEGSPGDTVVLSYTVTATNTPAAPVTVDFATSDGTPIAATAGSDYQALSGTLTFDPGDFAGGVATKTVNVTVIPDYTLETDEAVLLTLSNPGGASLGTASANGTIVDDDNQMSIGDATVNEGDSASATTNAVFTITLARPAPAGGAAFRYATSDGGATAGSDYDAVPLTTATVPAGATTTTINVAVRGDLRVEGNEDFYVNLESLRADTNVTDGVAQGVIVDNDTAPITIAAIQGNTDVSPVAGNTVTSLNNVVTAVVTTPATLRGFVMQMRGAGDGDLATSDAIFVFTGSVLPSVNVGDIVDVRGRVVDFNSTSTGRPSLRLTEFTNSSPALTINVVGSIAPGALDTEAPPIVLDGTFPSPNAAVPACEAAGGSYVGALTAVRNLECLEWMRVRTSTGVITGPNQFFSSDPYAEMYMTAGGYQAFREPGVGFSVSNENTSLAVISPPAPLLPAGYVFDQNTDVFEIDPDRLGQPNQVLVPGTRVSVTGIMAVEFADYEVWASSLTVDAAAPALPIATPAPAADQLTIGSLNLHRLYDRCDDPTRTNTPSGSEVVNVAQAAVKLDEISRYIRTLENSPIIVAVQEAEQPSAPGTVCANGEPDTSALQLLADKIAQDGGPTYTVVYGAVANDVGYINNGFLYRADLLANVTVSQLQANETFDFTYTDGSAVPTQRTKTAPLHDRPTMLLQATSNIPGTSPQPIAVMNNHFRSLNGIDSLSDTYASGDPVTEPTIHQNAHRIRQKKMRQAISVACQVQAFQTVNPDVPLVLVGDFNSFEFSDGYSDPIGILRGDTDPSTTEYSIGFNGTPAAPCVVQGNGQIVVPKLQEALFSLPALQRYSYSFNGSAQTLDHTLLTQAAQARFEGFAYARGDADAAEREQNTLTPGIEVLGASDHDGMVVYLNYGSDATQSGFGIFKDGFE